MLCLMIPTADENPLKKEFAMRYETYHQTDTLMIEEFLYNVRVPPIALSAVPAICIFYVYNYRLLLLSSRCEDNGDGGRGWSLDTLASQSSSVVTFLEVSGAVYLANNFS